jgi:hypothetical protein
MMSAEQTYISSSRRKSLLKESMIATVEPLVA